MTTTPTDDGKGLAGAANPAEEKAFSRWRSILGNFIGSSQQSPSPASNATNSENGVASAPVDPQAEEKDRARCERWKKKLLQSSPMVKFMLENLEKAGCPFTEKHFRCTPCDVTRAGGFAPNFGVVLCQNSFLSKQHMEDTMTHELIHAYDQCTAKVDWNNCEHYACSAIRAANLSGDCKFTRELRRGFFEVAKHHQACVKRRAIAELKQLPHCQGPNVAEDAVRAVWDSCFNDTAPFDEIP
ncbi:Mitochondrial inner membrane protease atp23 [Gaertneriomyces sp. JEL0708]|nr:Mitochondrial inner membrane protease atp23 [Gaertneriomyces sp. JEL0708]